MVFIISEIVTWNGSGDSVSPNEKLAWDLGKKKSYVILHQSGVCIFGKKTKLHPSYTCKVQYEACKVHTRKAVHCSDALG